jgi:hypothetical protein
MEGSVYKTPEQHVVPLNDLLPHECSQRCWCKPTRDEEEINLWVHHSMDGREETYEQGKVH